MEISKTFIWPTDTRRITSAFRTPGKAAHHGIDIANPGKYYIKAAAAGKITRSYRSDSYGECVMIVHSIHGETWETVYAHMRVRSRKVKVGDVVKQGQKIGVMGNTGNSTGQHLHFEVHKGRWNINKTHAVDPVTHLNKNLYPNTSEWTTITGNWRGQTLKKRYKGKSVKQLQQMLANNHYYPDKEDKNNGVDGYYGVKTVDAVERYQLMHGLTVDGIAGIKTYNKLNRDKPKSSEKKYPLPSGILRIGNRGKAVKQLQRALDAANFKIGKIDGIYGAKIKNGVMRFQKVYDPYNADGVYGPRTKARLDKVVN